MAVKHLTYLDIPVGLRRRAADDTRARIKQALVNPFLTQDQKDHLGKEMSRVGQWEKGLLPIK